MKGFKRLTSIAVAYLLVTFTVWCFGFSNEVFFSLIFIVFAALFILEVSKGVKHPPKSSKIGKKLIEFNSDFESLTRVIDVALKRKGAFSDVIGERLRLAFEGRVGAYLDLPTSSVRKLLSNPKELRGVVKNENLLTLLFNNDVKDKPLNWFVSVLDEMERWSPSN